MKRPSNMFEEPNVWTFFLEDFELFVLLLLLSDDNVLSLAYQVEPTFQFLLRLQGLFAI